MTFEEISDQFVEEFRQNKKPSVDEYAKQYPEFAEEIKDLFPALILLERGGKSDSMSSLSSFDSKAEDGTSCPERISNYRIIREMDAAEWGSCTKLRTKFLIGPLP